MRDELEESEQLQNAVYQFKKMIEGNAHH